MTAGSIAAALKDGKLSLDFLDAPAWNLPAPLPITYREFAEERGIPLDLLRGIHESMGFAAPDPDDRIPPDDLEIAALVRLVLDAGASEECVRRLFRSYGDNLRRLARAEADLYIEELEHRWAGSGVQDPELMRRGAELGRRLAGPVDGTIRAIYDRNRQDAPAPRASSGSARAQSARSRSRESRDAARRDRDRCSKRSSVGSSPSVPWNHVVDNRLLDPDVLPEASLGPVAEAFARPPSMTESGSTPRRSLARSSARRPPPRKHCPALSQSTSAPGTRCRPESP